MGQFQNQLAGAVTMGFQASKIGTNILGTAGPDLTKLPSFNKAYAATGSDLPESEAADAMLSTDYDAKDELNSGKISFAEALQNYDAVRQYQYEAKLVQDRQYMKQLFALMSLGGNH